MFKAMLIVCALNHVPHIETQCFKVYDLKAPKGYNKINDCYNRASEMLILVRDRMEYPHAIRVQCSIEGDKYGS